MDKFTFPRGGFTEPISAVTIDWNGPKEEPERERETERRARKEIETLYIYRRTQWTQPATDVYFGLGEKETKTAL